MMRLCQLLVAFLCVSFSVALQKTELELDSDDAQAKEFPWPVFYLHVPKTAGGFATSVLHSACTDCVAEAVDVPIGGMFTPGACCANKFARFDSDHYPIYGSDYDALPKPRNSHVISLFREPRQRLISGFYHNRHNCGYLKELEAPGCTGDDNKEPTCAPLLNTATPEKLDKYAQCVGSCAYNLFTMTKGQKGEYCGHETKEGFEEEHNSSDMNTVLDTIDDLGFVGLADEYELTVCLWHKRFGTPCLAAEFSNLRLGLNRKDSLYRTEVFTRKAEAWLTPDSKIYARARTRFYKELSQYGVTRSSCSQVCPEPAEVWTVDGAAPAPGLDLLSMNIYSSYELDWPGRKAFDVD